MLIKTLPVGQLETNCYVVSDENTLDCVVIDPGDESNAIMDYLESNKLNCRYIFITHGHFDHIMAAREVQAQTGAPLYVSSADTGGSIREAQFRLKPDENTLSYAEGDRFTVGGLEFSVMETPGHSPGGVTLMCGDALFTGDTLFRDSCGRTDLPGGDMDALLRSLLRLRKLPGEFEIYPGHAAATTLDRERRFNYYMKYAAETLGV